MTLSGLPYLPSLLRGFFLPRLTSPTHNPTDVCLQNSTQTLVGLSNCFEQFIVREGFYDENSYAAAQPTARQREAWFSAVTNLMYTDGNCTSAIVPATIRDIYCATPFTDSSNGKEFCVLYERTTSLNKSGKPQFTKGWGYMIVPASNEDIARHVHLAGPHSVWDGYTSRQAVGTFNGSGGKSVLIAGRTRTSYMNDSVCVRGTMGTKYWITDPAHNDREPFYDANIALWRWQSTTGGGCPNKSCAFVQFHGKGKMSCVGDEVFLSTGLRNNPWYTDDVDRPIKRLKRELTSAFNSTISLPSDSNCRLTATLNVVGRFLNTLPEDPFSHYVCTQAANASTTRGMFIHAEQTMESTAMVEEWVQAINNTFVDVRSI